MNSQQKKLHLGCGQTYLQGYENIDFPPSQHTVQTRSVADRFADLTQLSYPPSSLEEVRLHHVFEHFPRPVAFGLLMSWYRWLKPNGQLQIEVPDYCTNAWISILPFVPKRLKYGSIRHIFGSHEAPWAIHCEGWSRAYLKEALRSVGFEITSVRRSRWRGIFNLTIVGKKPVHEISPGEQISRLDRLLENFLVDRSESELKLLTYWKDEVRSQFEKCGGMS